MVCLELIWFCEKRQGVQLALLSALTAKHANIYPHMEALCLPQAQEEM